MMGDKKPSRFAVWALASRPHTLTASIAPVVVGCALTARLIHENPGLIERRSRICDAGGGESSCTDIDSVSAWTSVLPLAVQFGLFACLIQVSTNLHNDYADFVKGADTDKRVGQARATQRGWLTPYETCRGCVLCMLAALIVGMVRLVPLERECFADDSEVIKRDPYMVFIVASSLFNAVAYTGGPFPLGYIGLGNVSIGYSGLGDLFVFLYFGIIATLGVPYLYLTHVACLIPTSEAPRQELLSILATSFWYSLPVSNLATSIIVVNNLRDRHTDVGAGKKTLAVRFGGTFVKCEYFILVVGSYAFCLFQWAIRTNELLDLLPLLSVPFSVRHLRAVSFGYKDGQALNEHVGGTAKLQLAYCLLLAAGLGIRR
mmetsp:Transcript_20767/g.46989  ORF Transcript_20767/g.46989 Transcript_20767/m.46989 type:complete len:375 (-) Transcript_20767:670-1794(-)